MMKLTVSQPHESREEMTYIDTTSYKNTSDLLVDMINRPQYRYYLKSREGDAQVLVELWYPVNPK